MDKKLFSDIVLALGIVILVFFIKYENKIQVIVNYATNINYIINFKVIFIIILLVMPLAYFFKILFLCLMNIRFKTKKKVMGRK